ncbi:hypothetical protein NIES4102_34210 [Chondrocystis sp. NIES-4102]|nr:hypothetical protein NIES4102_34210 [Chondrocystis sp. NIES-4102]
MTNNNLNADYQQQLAEIGLKLQQIRTAKNISLETIAANTKITKRLLSAIETGNIQELPEPFYIKALVNKFAQAIGAEDVEFVILSNLETEESHPQVNSLNKRPYLFNFQLRSLHLYWLYIILIILSVTGITMLIERPIIINQIPEQEPVLDPSVATSTSSPVASQPKSAPQFVSSANNSESVTVGINLQERCWLKVMVDGQVAFEGTLSQGTQRQWTGKKEVTIRAGNAGGVVISFNNEQQKVLGAPGQVEEITYTVN